mmetsp:Transcript_19833/g.54747  ORF Transcript_19833/g.54747 Transcript_19833/m.54747 type:complete len:232 (+) Transcript_19833:2373-3068(+)
MPLPSALRQMRRGTWTKALADLLRRLSFGQAPQRVEVLLGAIFLTRATPEAVLQELHAENAENHQKEQRHEHHVGDGRDGPENSHHHLLHTLAAGDHAQRPQSTQGTKSLNPADHLKLCPEGGLVQDKVADRCHDDEEVEHVPSIAEIAMTAAHEPINDDFQDRLAGEEACEHKVHTANDALGIWIRAGSVQRKHESTDRDEAVGKAFEVLMPDDNPERFADSVVACDANQ